MKTDKKKVKNDAKKLFLKKGTCSHTFFYILNREFGASHNAEQSASDSLAGGIYREGYQCGMLWGSTLAAGAESFRRNENRDEAIRMAITATQHLVESFTKRTNTVECSDITETDWSSKLSLAKYALTGKFMTCFNLAEKWAPEAIEAAKEGLSKTQNNSPCLSCASEVVKKMGASDEEMVMVAGFAGGLGFSGNACGALGAAIWMRNLTLFKNQPDKKTGMHDPEAEKTLKAFYAETDYEILCPKISGQNFKNIDEHTKFIKNGGCEKLIELLATI